MTLSADAKKAILMGVALVTACAAPESTEFPSPNGKLIARLISDHGGGAANSSYQFIELQASHAPDRQTIFVGENMGGRSTASVLFGEMNVSWHGDYILLIEYCGGLIMKHVRSAEVDGTKVQVVLKQERRGQWPDTVPISKRAGPPPCT